MTITIGVGLIGDVAGEMAVTNPAIKGWVDIQSNALHQYRSPVRR
jgi:hypothetical protein